LPTDGARTISEKATFGGINAGSWARARGLESGDHLYGGLGADRLFGDYVINFAQGSDADSLYGEIALTCHPVRVSLCGMSLVRRSLHEGLELAQGAPRAREVELGSSDLRYNAQ
jgi:hypothetical protein